MMTYQYDVSIDVHTTRAKIIDALINEETMKQWQPALVSIEKLSQHVRLLIYANGAHHMQMKETTVKDERPDAITLLYEVTGVKNVCRNIWSEHEDHVKWTMEVTFSFEKDPGLPQSAFEQNTESSMLQLKSYLESQK